MVLVVDTGMMLLLWAIFLLLVVFLHLVQLMPSRPRFDDGRLKCPRCLEPFDIRFEVPCFDGLRYCAECKRKGVCGC